jgi:hypothetical protein
MNAHPGRPTVIGFAISIALLVTACGGGTGASGAPLAPSQPVQASDTPVTFEPAPGGGGPGVGAGELTVPRPGQLDVRPVAAQLIEAAVDGRRVTLRITWTSGVEPCYVLDAIVVDRSDAAFAITLREGHGPGDNVCIDIAKQKQAIVELGELDPGSYTISDTQGGAAPISVVVN